MPSSAPTRRPPPSQKPRSAAASQPALEVVDPRWLLKALAVCFLAALLCGYATLCLLFYQGDWQLVLHPSHTVDRTPASAGLAFTPIKFDAAETGQPRLTAWWISAASSSGLQTPNAAFTILYLHDGSGSLADTVPALALLHQTGLNIFAIDYRGFGTSDSSLHPSAERMAEDATAALNYLTNTRHLPPTSIVPYATGLAAALATNLAQTHHELPAVILDNPNPDPASIAIAAHPADPVPMRLLFGDQFAIAKPLGALATPKLLIAGGPSQISPKPDQHSLDALFASAASPHIAVTLPAGADNRTYLEALRRFLDQYLPGNNAAPPVPGAKTK